MRWWDIEPVMVLESQLFSPDTWSAETFWGELAAGNTYLVEQRDGEIVGYAGVSVAGGTADVQTIAVAPAAQGQGLGQQLLTGLIEAARQQNASEILLEVRADNDSAQRLYRRNGFERIAIRRRYYQPGNIDAHIMRLRPLPARSGDPQQRPTS